MRTLPDYCVPDPDPEAPPLLPPLDEGDPMPLPLLPLEPGIVLEEPELLPGEVVVLLDPDEP